MAPFCVRVSNNNVRLHGAIGYVTPKDMLEGGQARVHADRELKLEQARRLRGEKRLQARREYSSLCEKENRMLHLYIPGETEAGNAGERPAEG